VRRDTDDLTTGRFQSPVNRLPQDCQPLISQQIWNVTTDRHQTPRRLPQPTRSAEEGVVVGVPPTHCSRTELGVEPRVVFAPGVAVPHET
jgi:hypothetical protein